MHVSYLTYLQSSVLSCFIVFLLPLMYSIPLLKYIICYCYLIKLYQYKEWVPLQVLSYKKVIFCNHMLIWVWQWSIWKLKLFSTMWQVVCTALHLRTAGELKVCLPALSRGRLFAFFSSMLPITAERTNLSRRIFLSSLSYFHSFPLSYTLPFSALSFSLPFSHSFLSLPMP